MPPTRDGERVVTLGDFLRAGRYSGYFVRHFMVPLVSCVWSCPPQTALRYPARSLFTFLDHHGALSVTGSPQWRTVVGGSRSYVERAAKELTATELSTPVRGIARVADGIEIRDDADVVRRFDRVVVATHADDALALLTSPTPAERAALGTFGSSTNETILHTDASLLPRRSRARASWNYLLDRCATDAGEVRVSYHMNRLHRLDEPLDYVVTLNPGDARRRRRGAGAHDATPIPCTPPSRWRRRPRCPRSTMAGSRTRARTTGGASTKTGAHPACGPPRRWGWSGEGGPLPHAHHARPDRACAPRLHLRARDVARRSRRRAPAAARRSGSSGASTPATISVIPSWASAPTSTRTSPPKVSTSTVVVC